MWTDNLQVGPKVQHPVVGVKVDCLRATREVESNQERGDETVTIFSLDPAFKCLLNLIDYTFRTAMHT